MVKQIQAQQAFEKLVNRHGLANCKVAHYQSESGSLRVGIGRNAEGVLAGVYKWYYPELDQDGRSLHYAQFMEFVEGTTEEEAHQALVHFGDQLAEKMLNGEAAK